MSGKHTQKKSKKILRSERVPHTHDPRVVFEHKRNHKIKSLKHTQKVCSDRLVKDKDDVNAWDGYRRVTSELGALGVLQE